MSAEPAAAPLNFCSDTCRAVDEPLFATATRADVWLLLEYSGRWGSKAFPESALPERIKDHLGAHEQAHPHTRIQFIKKAPPYESDRIQFFAAVSHEAQPRLYRFDLDSYEALLDVDLGALVTGADRYDEQRRTKPLFLVCTNGLRDACCAKYGLDLFYAVEEVAGEAVWQTTHLGGHRFAPIALALPHALHYGQTQPEEAGALVDAYRRGEVYLSRYRGRTIYEQPVQAAEHFVRQEDGDNRIDAYKLVGQSQTGEDEWEVRLRARETAEIHTLRVAAAPFGRPLLKSCSAEEPETVKHFHLLEHQVTHHTG